MIISGNGDTLDFAVMKNLKIKVIFPLERKDMSGSGADSMHVDMGAKPQKISISGIVPVEKGEFIAKLKQLATAKRDDGTVVQYQISHDICEIMKIRAVIFEGDITVSDPDGTRAYPVSLGLLEQSTAAEAVQQRETTKAVENTTAQATNATIIGTTNPEQINRLID